MTIKVLFFAQLKDFFGEDERVVEIDEGITIRELAESIFREREGASWKTLPFRYAVNEKFMDYNTQLHSGDVLALIPPVSGG